MAPDQIQLSLLDARAAYINRYLTVLDQDTQRTALFDEQFDRNELLGGGILTLLHLNTLLYHDTVESAITNITQTIVLDMWKTSHQKPLEIIRKYLSQMDEQLSPNEIIDPSNLHPVLKNRVSDEQLTALDLLILNHHIRATRTSNHHQTIEALCHVMLKNILHQKAIL